MPGMYKLYAVFAHPYVTVLTPPLTQFNLDTQKRVIGKQCKTRSDAVECGICSGSQMLANSLAIFIAPACSRVRYRRPIFCPSVRPSVSPSVRQSVRLSTFMSTFDIYVKVSILINYKTKQQSNLAWNISLTSWLCNIGVRFSVCLSIRPFVRQSTFMSKFDIYVKVSILINYKTKQTLHETSPWPPDFATQVPTFPFVCLFVCPSVRLLTVLLCLSSTFMSKLVF